MLGGARCQVDNALSALADAYDVHHTAGIGETARCLARWQHDAQEKACEVAVRVETAQTFLPADGDETTDALTRKLAQYVALTLRMVKPWIGTGRVLIADSWFGSVPCILALFAVGLFAVMMVKTAHKGYPKTELLQKLGWEKKSAGLPEP